MFAPDNSCVPNILNHEHGDVLVPIKIDVTHGDGRHFDSFCWNLYNSFLTPEEFVWQSCLEENLPSELVPRIVAQLQEQVAAFKSLAALVATSGDDVALRQRLGKVMTEVCVRSNVIEYSDSFQWNDYGVGAGPEDFARQTCADLGLPAEMQPVIALRTRESIFREVLSALERAEMLQEPSSVADTVSRISLQLLSPQEVVAQVSELCKDGAPRGQRVKEAGFQGAPLPSDKTNAVAWL
mmetsp:Transcript_1738/g.3263  ORF Transcript_1738/g.3263 Transcript_1738/m.3263 type:complete len:239 (+) Transcript_1738:115-831(+)